jgi:hypothetical protein
MGLSEWFSSFCDNIKVKNSDTISTRYKQITRRLNTDFWDTTSDTAHSLYVGSYGRNTAIDGLSDLDVLMELPYSVYQRYNGYATNGQSALLQAVKASIERTYSSTNLKADGQVIQVPFTDGVTFEVVPAFENTDGSFTFPNANDGGSWKTTNPRPEIQAIRGRNANCNFNLVPLCRMMRAWKTKWDVDVGGMLIDTFAYQFIENYEYRDKSYLYYDFLCRDFFKWVSEQDEKQYFWKAPGSGQWIYGSGFQYKAKRCYNIALSAIAHETKNPKEEWSAKNDWRQIFGSAFPD